MRQPSIEFYKDRKKEHRWRVKAGNGRVLADSGEGYSRIGKAVDGLEAAFQAMASIRMIMMVSAMQNDPVTAIGKGKPVSKSPARKRKVRK